VRALLYDIHGNLPALEAVLANAHEAGAESFVLGGDYALFGARPKETVELLRELDAVWIRGNTERWVAPFSQEPDLPDQPLVRRSRDYCLAQLGELLAHELAALPEREQLEEVLFCHASPRSDMVTFGPEQSEHDDQLLSGTAQGVVVFGHSHLQFSREAGGRLLVNPGSVGMPFDGDRRAAYALWDEDRRFELRRVEYDTASYVAHVSERMSVTLGDAVQTLVRRLEQATF
jgi:putative phosphoesterase